MKPSVGRIVLFSEGGTEAPAIVTRVWSDSCVNLQPFPVDRFPGEHTSVCFAEQPSSVGSSWRWPPRV